MMALLSFTLDTNCVIDLEENRPAAPAVRRLERAHATGLADVAVVAIMASETQRPEGYLEDFEGFKDRLARLGLAHLRLLPTIGYWNITFWGWFLWSDAGMQVLERDIHQILFPRYEFLWEDYCSSKGLDPAMSPIAFPLGRKWRNRKCDVLGYGAICITVVTSL
jgi:hypothetical protein